MDETLKKVDVFIGTSIRGPGKGVGRCAYAMKYLKKDGKFHEHKPEVAQYEQATESRLVLYAIREALSHMNFACEIIIHTECSYVAAAINQHWPEKWQKDGWKNKRGKDAADCILWSEIMQELEETGHLIQAEEGKHEYSHWMKWKFPLVEAWNEAFVEMEKN